MIGAAVVEKPKYVYSDYDRRGSERIYFWRGRGHPKVRVREDEDSPEFWESYGKLLRGHAADKPTRYRRSEQGTFRWLCEQYFARSAEFKRMGDSTRKVRRGRLEQAQAETREPGSSDLFGDCPIGMMTPIAIGVLRDRKADFPEAANERLKAIRQVFKWAARPDIGLVNSNPARDVPYIQNNSDGFHTWTVEEVQQYEKRHPIGTKARLALALLLFTGVRRSDVVLLGRQMIKDGWLTFTEIKGRARKVKVRDVPVLDELREVLDATPLGNLTFLTTEFDRPFTRNGWGNWFRKRCNEAGLPHCSAHGVRKAGATIAAENGASEHQLMAIFGWETTKQAGVYTKKANRKRMAGDAMHLVVPIEKGTDVSHSAEEFKKVGKKTAKRL